MSEPKYIDLLIQDGDLVLDVGGLPQYVDNRASIAQDILHMIMETGLLVELVANRDEMKKAENKVKIIIEVESDERIVPGSCEITEPSLGLFYLVADTVDFGPIQLDLGVTK